MISVRYKKSLIFSVILFIVISIYLFAQSRKDGAIVEEKKFLMGTIVEMKVPVGYGGDKKIVRSVIKKAFEEIERVEGVFSVFKNDSEISKINNLKKGEKMKVSDEVFDLLKKSIEYNKKTGGAFDITVKPLVDLWGVKRGGNLAPKVLEIKEALKKVGYDKMTLDESDRSISFNEEGMAIDLGGIAKGYATSRAIKILKENGIKNAIVNSGGDMYCLGKKSEKGLWKVGIQHPRNRNKIFLELKLKDKAIDTSGDYEKYFLSGGKRYSHIIDPRTGYAVGDNVVSATVIAKDSMTADMLATALCVLGPKEGLDMINSTKDVDAVIVFKEGDKLIMKMSEGFKKRYEVIDERL